MNKVIEKLRDKDTKSISKIISTIENQENGYLELLSQIYPYTGKAYRLGITGPPGSGKGTQAELLCEKQGLLHLSTGDLLRAEVAAATTLGLEVAELMNSGGLVSDSLVLSIVYEIN